MAYQIVDSNYGKYWVKLLHVTRNGPDHTIREWEVCSELTLDSKKDYTYLAFCPLADKQMTPLQSCYRLRSFV